MIRRWYFGVISTSAANERTKCRGRVRIGESRGQAEAWARREQLWRIKKEGERDKKGRVFRRVVHRGVGKQGRSTSGSTPVVHDGNALVSMQTGRTPPYLTHNQILTWEVADARTLRTPSLSPSLFPFLSLLRFVPPFLVAKGRIEIEIVISIEPTKRVSDMLRHLVDSSR